MEHFQRIMMILRTFAIISGNSNILRRIMSNYGSNGIHKWMRRKGEQYFSGRTYVTLLYSFHSHSIMFLLERRNPLDFKRQLNFLICARCTTALDLFLHFSVFLISWIYNVVTRNRHANISRISTNLLILNISNRNTSGKSRIKICDLEAKIKKIKFLYKIKQYKYI